MKGFFSPWRCLAMIALVGMAVACEKTPPPPPPAEEEEIPQPEDYVFLADDVPEELTKAEREKVASLGDFSFAFFNTVSSETKGSFVISPVSITYLLGMLAEATEGTARTEITEAIGFGQSGLMDLHRFCRNLMVLSANADPKSTLMEIANVIIYNQHYTVREDYRKTIKNFYDADVLAFNPAKETESLQLINKWASDHTHGRIPKITDELWDCVLMNALYFNSFWQKERFNPDKTKEEAFYNDKGNQRTVSMMHLQSDKVQYRYMDGSAFSMMEFPLGDSPNYVMTFLLPHKKVELETVARTLDYTAWNTAVSSMKWEYVDIALPKFTVNTEKTLASTLEGLGIHRLFGTASISRLFQDNQEINLQMIKQLANISVDEKGVEASAVSFSGMAGSAPPEEEPVYKEFHADHPFMFLIQEKKTGAILFMGCYQ